MTQEVPKSWMTALSPSLPCRRLGSTKDTYAVVSTTQPVSACGASEGGAAWPPHITIPAAA